MKFLYALFVLTTVLIVNSKAQSSTGFEQKDSVTRKLYTLVFINHDPAFAQTGDSVKKQMIEAFFNVYPAEAKVYNKNTLKRVTFLIDPEYKGVAETDGGVVRYNPHWMLRKPADIDVVTHEVMHIVQEYGYSAGPVWLTEGIADYARYKFGVDNLSAKWTLPDYKAGQNYTNSYRITARFFIWLEENGHKNIVKELDSRLRKHTYTDSTWKELTGKTLDELWTDYTNNPGLTLTYR
jgi:hypothetical protein